MSCCLTIAKLLNLWPNNLVSMMFYPLYRVNKKAASLVQL
jgi:hypothetical protein